MHKSTEAVVTARCWHREALGESGDITITEKSLGADELLTEKLLQDLLATQQPAAVQLWLNSKDMAVTTSWLAKQSRLPGTIFASWKLLDENTSVTPDNLRDKFYLTYPRDLPDNSKRNISVLKRWLKIRKIPATNLDIQSQMYFLGWMLPGAITHMRSEFFRDYFNAEFHLHHLHNNMPRAYRHLFSGTT